MEGGHLAQLIETEMEASVFAFVWVLVVNLAGLTDSCTHEFPIISGAVGQGPGDGWDKAAWSGAGTTERTAGRWRFVSSLS